MTPLLRPLLCVATLGAATASAQRFTLTDLGNPTPEASNLTAFINNQETIVLTSTLTGGFDNFEGTIVGQGGDQVARVSERLDPAHNAIPPDDARHARGRDQQCESDRRLELRLRGHQPVECLGFRG